MRTYVCMGQTGISTAVAGSYTATGSTDGIGTTATFDGPMQVVLDSANRYAYIAGCNDVHIRRVLVLPPPVVSSVTPNAGVWNGMVGSTMTVIVSGRYLGASAGDVSGVT